MSEPKAGINVLVITSWLFFEAIFSGLCQPTVSGYPANSGLIHVYMLLYLVHISWSLWDIYWSL